MKLLLVEPEFPIPKKSKNHNDFLPIGLLKLGSMHRSIGDRVKLIRGKKTKKEIALTGDGMWYVPDKIMLTTLFTYWKSYVEESIQYYRKLYPKAEIEVGGIYASLMHDDCLTIDGVNSVYKGVHPIAEKYPPAYNLIEANPHPVDYQIIHSSRGCPRQCNFCGTWKIEPQFIPEKSIKDKIKKKKIVFYDNNLLLNPNIEYILDELIELKIRKRIKWCESQSGFDGRVLLERPELAKKIKKAGFKNVRIAWDGRLKEHSKIEKQKEILVQAGYNQKQQFVFMLYNWDIKFEEMEKKRIKCFEWGVQISDCRYRPLDRTNDNYNPRAYKKGQTDDDYHIHKEARWTDARVRQFRKNVRRQNICIRHGFSFYSKDLERMRFSKKKIKQIIKTTEKMKTKEKKKKYLEKEGADYWFPDEITYPKNN